MPFESDGRHVERSGLHRPDRLVWCFTVSAREVQCCDQWHLVQRCEGIENYDVMWRHLISCYITQAYFEHKGQDVFICPVIMGSDATHLTFSGSQKAHNVYITPGVMHAQHRQKMGGSSSYNIIWHHVISSSLVGPCSRMTSHDITGHHMTSYNTVLHRVETVRSNSNLERKRSGAQAQVIYSRHAGHLPRGDAQNIEATWSCCLRVCCVSHIMWCNVISCDVMIGPSKFFAQMELFGWWCSPFVFMPVTGQNNATLLA